MFLVAMLYLLGVMASSIACVHTNPRWLQASKCGGAAEPSAVLVTSLLWPLLIVGVAQFFVSVGRHKLEVRRVLLIPFSHA